MEKEMPQNYYEQEDFAAGGTYRGEEEGLPPKIEEEEISSYMKENPEVTHDQAKAALQLEQLEGSKHDAFSSDEIADPLPVTRPNEFTPGQLGDLEEAERDDWEDLYGKDDEI